MRAVGILLLGLMLASPALGFFRAANKIKRLELFARTFRVMQVENYLLIKSLDVEQFKALKQISEAPVESYPAMMEGLDLERYNVILELELEQIKAIGRLSTDKFKAIQRLDND